MYSEQSKNIASDILEDPAPKKRKLEHDLLGLEKFYEDDSTLDNYEKEFEQYSKASRAPFKTNILNWWKMHQKAYPTLAGLARDVLSIPATSVPIERVFSQGSLTMTKTRCSLKDGSLRNLMCINSWARSS